MAGLGGEVTWYRAGLQRRHRELYLRGQSEENGWRRFYDIVAPSSPTGIPVFTATKEATGCRASVVT